MRLVFFDLETGGLDHTRHPIIQIAAIAVDEDGPFLQAFYKQNDAFLPATYRVMDTCQRAIWHFHERPECTPPADFKLGTLCAHFGIPLDNAHDALADVRATLALYRCLTAKGAVAA